MTSFDAHDAAQEAAKRNLWLHFTRMSPTKQRCPRDRARIRRLLSSTSTAGVTWTGSPGCLSARFGHGRREIAEAGARQATSWRISRCVLRAPKAIELAARLAELGSRAAEPGLLHHQAARRRSIGMEARQAVLQADRPARPVQGDQPGHCLPRHVDGRAVRHRLATSSTRSSRCCPAACGCRTPTSTARLTSWPETKRSSAGGPRTRSSGHPARGPAVGRGGCTWSRCRTPAGCFPRRPGTSSGSGNLRPVRRAAGLGRGDLRVRRLGYYFGSQRYEYQPDIITFARA